MPRIAQPIVPSTIPRGFNLHHDSQLTGLWKNYAVPLRMSGSAVLRSWPCVTLWLQLFEEFTSYQLYSSKGKQIFSLTIPTPEESHRRICHHAAHSQSRQVPE